MKRVICVLLLLGMITLTSCSTLRSADRSNQINQSTNNSLENEKISVNYETFHADYPYYSTIDEMKEKANLVFIGTVRSVSFELLDMYTMKPVDKLDSAGFPLINTIYEVEVNHAYSDMKKETVKIRIEGGLRNQLIDKQVTTARTNTIVVQEDSPSLICEESYLFALYLAENANYASIINPFQSIYSLNNIGDCSESQMFSVEDIMSSYSNNAVSEFLNKKDEWLK